MINLQFQDCSLIIDAGPSRAGRDFGAVADEIEIQSKREMKSKRVRDAMR